MNNDYRFYLNNNYLSHYGVMGMKWGVRRYQNEDGSLTPAGQKRQNRLDRKETFRSGKAATIIGQAYNKSSKAAAKATYAYAARPTAKRMFKKQEADAINTSIGNDYKAALNRYKEAAAKTNTPIKYDRTGKVKAPIRSMSANIANSAINLTGLLWAVGATPFGMIRITQSAKGAGNRYYRQYKRMYRDMPLSIATNANTNNPEQHMRHSSCDIGENYLMHFGILGMKWGKRNGPPYPLDKSDYSASEKKAIKNNEGSGNNVISKEDDGYGFSRKTILYNGKLKNVSPNCKIQTANDTKICTRVITL